MSPPPPRSPTPGAPRPFGAPAPGAAGPRAAAARPGEGERPQFGEVLDALEREIANWKRQTDRFLAGAEEKPPLAERGRVEAHLRQLRDAPLGAGDRFRLGSLEARFNSLSELFGRRVREREEGPRARLPPPPPPALDPREGISVGARPGGAAVEALFQGLYRDSREPPRFDLDSFGRYLQQQVATIQQKTGCTEVQFRVAVEDGKVKLKAKPIQSSTA